MNIHTVTVFGWLQDSFVGMEQESAYNLSAGYLKGAEQAGAGARITLDVKIVFGNASKKYTPSCACMILCECCTDYYSNCMQFWRDI